MKPIKYALNPNLRAICQQAIQLESLNQLLQLYLPKEVKPHCKVGNFNRGCLNLVVDDPVWVSLLRFELPNLRDILRNKARLYQLASIKISVQSAQISDKKIDKSQHKISTAAILALNKLRKLQ